MASLALPKQRTMTQDTPGAGSYAKSSRDCDSSAVKVQVVWSRHNSALLPTSKRSQPREIAPARAVCTVKANQICMLGAFLPLGTPESAHFPLGQAEESGVMEPLCAISIRGTRGSSGHNIPARFVFGLIVGSSGWRLGPEGRVEPHSGQYLAFAGSAKPVTLDGCPTRNIDMPLRIYRRGRGDRRGLRESVDESSHAALEGLHIEIDEQTDAAI